MDFKFPEIIKTISSYWPALFLASTILLFSTDNLVNTLGLISFVKEYQSILGIIWVVTHSFGIIHFGKIFFSWVNKKIIIPKNKLKSFEELSNEEKKYLAFYLEKNTKTNYGDISDGLVRGLEKEGFIYRASDFGLAGRRFQYNLCSWAWKVLKKNPDLVDHKKTD